MLKRRIKATVKKIKEKVKSKKLAINELFDCLVIKLKKTLDVFGAPVFKDVMKEEVERLNIQSLPLQAGLSQGSYVSESNFTVMILGVSEEAEIIIANASIFYTSIIAGCNCADDPSPIDEQTEYCEVQFEINKKTAVATVKLLS